MKNRISCFTILLISTFCREACALHQDIKSNSANCTARQFSYFQLLQLPNGGIIYNISADNVSSNYLKIQHARVYLPPLPTKEVRADLYACDKIFSLSIDHWVAINTKKVPYGVGFKKISVGKFVYYNGLMEFKYFNALDIIEISINKFSWARNVQECTGEFSDWNCVFQKLPSKNSTRLSSHSRTAATKYQSLITNIMSHRTTHENHAIQLLLFGKLLQLISEPTSIIETFLLSNLVIVKGENSDSFSSLLNCVGQNCKVGNISALLKFARIVEESSVSMHVRGGDACDVMISNDDTVITEYIINEKRPCFTPAVYLRKLAEMKKLYDVSVVFLATDSLEMVEMTKLDSSFTWVFLDIERSHFQKSKGFIECREPIDDRLTFFSAAADIYLMQFGSFFIGSFASIFSKLIYYRMIGHKMRLLPFISVDYPISCDAYDKCSAADIDKRFSSVRNMILHSQDCEYFPGDLCRLKFDGNTTLMTTSKLQSDYEDGSLLKSAKRKEIFYMENGRKRSIPDWDYFLCRKFDLKKVIVVSSEILDAIPTGEPLQI